jgi:uncharacterized membrane protein
LAPGLLLLCYGMAMMRQQPSEKWWDRLPPSFWFLSALFMLLSSLVRLADGTALTLWFTLLALGAMVPGFLLRDRTARLSGMLLLLFCVFKLFLYDLRNLEGMMRILSFMVLGVVLIAISYIYTRTRSKE